MKKWIVIAALFCLAAVPAFADVSNEVVVGWEGDSTSEVKIRRRRGPERARSTTKNSLFTVQYTHFFTPLKDDDKPIDLRQFYQHPSTLSAGLAFIGPKDKDNTFPDPKPTARRARAFSSSAANTSFPRTPASS